jgi:hypothetical protein
VENTTDEVINSVAFPAIIGLKKKQYNCAVL